PRYASTSIVRGGVGGREEGGAWRPRRNVDTPGPQNGPDRVASGSVDRETRICDVGAGEGRGSVILREDSDVVPVPIGRGPDVPGVVPGCPRQERDGSPRQAPVRARLQREVL